MKLTIEEIQERVRRCEDERGTYETLAKKWQEAWELKSNDTRTLQQVMADGQERVVMPTPFTTIQLAQRLISSDPRVEVPALGDDDEQMKAAEKKERWLSAAWQQINRTHEANTVTGLTLYTLIRGRHALEVKWVGPIGTKSKDRRFPILVRALDPLTVFVRKNHRGTQYAFHRYDSVVCDLKQEHEGKKRLNKSVWDELGKDEDAQVKVVDFWWCNGDMTEVWNAVIVEDQFLLPPTKTDYKFVPLIDGLGDVGITMGGAQYTGLGLLHAIVDLWRYENRLHSQVGTGLLWYFWPQILIEFPLGQEIKDFQIGPGQTNPVPPGTRVQTVTINPNIPLANNMMGKIESAMQQSTFPSVMYGQAPGELSAGYGVSLLANAAKGRIKVFIENLERTLALANEQMLALVEAFAPTDGVEVWGKDEAQGRKFRTALTAEDIDGYYENTVALTPLVPSDDTQKMTMGLRMVESGMLSPDTFLDKFVSVPLPTDELEQAQLFKLLQSPEVFPVHAVQLLRKRFPDNWWQLVQGSPKLLQAAKGLGMAHPMPDGSWMPGASHKGEMEQMPMDEQSLQPKGMNYQGGAIPPEMQGQLKPQNVGLPANDQSGSFAALMGGGGGGMPPVQQGGR